MPSLVRSGPSQIPKRVQEDRFFWLRQVNSPLKCDEVSPKLTVMQADESLRRPVSMRK